MKIKYSIEKHENLGKKVKGNYVLWKEVESDRGYGFRGIFQGTRQECIDFLEKLKKGE